MNNCPVCGGKLLQNILTDGYTCGVCFHEFPDWMVNYGKEVSNEDLPHCALDEHGYEGLGCGA